MNNNQSFKQLLANKNFVKLWTSQLLSQMTINIMNFYVITRVYQATQSNIAVSLVWIASALPALVFGPFSGVLVDNFSRKKMLVLTNVLQAISVAGALFISPRHIFPLYVVTFLYWLFDQVYFPAQQASVPSLVPKKLLDAANGLFLITQQASILLGFGMGGVLLGLLGPKLTILLASLNLILAAISVKSLPADKSQMHITEGSFLRYWKDFLKGYHFVRTHHMVLIPMVLIVISQIYNAIISTALPSYTHEVLNMSLNNAGLVLIVPGGIGALLATIYAPKVFSGARKKKMIETGFGIGSIALLMMSVLKIIPWEFRIFVAVLVAVGMGIAVGMIIIPAQSLIQRNTPQWFRGRVYAQMGFLLIVATTIPLFISATLADSLGVGPMLAVMGLILLAGWYWSRQKGDHVLANGFGI